MIIQSLGRQTDLIFARFQGKVIDRGNYTLIQTPDNPGYHWGNYIIFNQPPQADSFNEWKKIFDLEYPYYKTPHHYSFTWNPAAFESKDIQPFLEAKFDFESATVLTTGRLNPPLHRNTEVEIRKVASEKDWDEVIQLQILCADEKFMNDYFNEFKKTQMRGYRKMSEAGIGSWFGAYLNGILVADLGVFFEDKIARYQSVGTHPNYRRKGICGTLVYEAGLSALSEYKVENLVMEADVSYHAARIYESVGFQRTETNHSLSWWRNKP